MKYFILCGVLVGVLTVTACASKKISNEEDKGKNSYSRISQDTAKEMMSKDDGHIIVDVRHQDEYDSGHIPGAICIPNEQINQE